MTENVLIFGANSDVGSFLLPRLENTGWTVYCFSRRKRPENGASNIKWLSDADFHERSTLAGIKIPAVISLMPIWLLPNFQEILEIIETTTLIAFSSSSIISKVNSRNNEERHIVDLLGKGEAWVNDRFSTNSRNALILRPAMIYGGMQNKNINRITHLGKIFRFFPLLGEGSGKRQPVHAEDLAQLCVSCLNHAQSGVKTYVLAGGETLPYRAMIERIFLTAGIPPRILILPGFFLNIVVICIRCLPNYGDITLEMLRRTEQDLCYDNQDAIDALGWSPRTFQP